MIEDGRDRELDKPWEPWEPKLGQWVRFRMGERINIPASCCGGVTEGIHPELLAYNGAILRVVDIFSDAEQGSCRHCGAPGAAQPGYRYALSAPYDIGDRHYAGFLAAAAELSPSEAPAQQVDA